MSFLISKDIEHRLDEETFIAQNNNQNKNEIYLLNQENFKSIRYKKFKKVLLTFTCSIEDINIFLNKKIKIIKFHSMTFKKLKIKEIIIEENKYMFKMLCKEKKIENIK
jgi:hypothetical protein